jgi:hypothetical protein
VPTLPVARDNGQDIDIIAAASSSVFFTMEPEMTEIIETPAFPIPILGNPHERILEFQSYLDPKSPDYISEGQHEKVKAVIQLGIQRRKNRWIQESVGQRRKGCFQGGNIQKNFAFVYGPSYDFTEWATGPFAKRRQPTCMHNLKDCLRRSTRRNA